MPSPFISAATTTHVASAATALTMNGSAEGLMSSSVLPSACSQALPNNGPYHSPPNANAAATATRMAHQLSPVKSIMSALPCRLPGGVWQTADSSW